MLDILTLVRGRNCDGLCCELVIEVTRVRLRCYLRLEGRNELRRRKEVLLHSETLILNVFFICRYLTFFSRTSCQLMEVKNLWIITSLASSGPPPSLRTKQKHHHLFHQTGNCANTYNKCPCCVVPFCNYQFLDKFSAHRLLTVHVSVSQAELNVLIIAAPRVFPHTAGGRPKQQSITSSF